MYPMQQMCCWKFGFYYTLFCLLHVDKNTFLIVPHCQKGLKSTNMVVKTLKSRDQQIRVQILALLCDAV